MKGESKMKKLLFAVSALAALSLLAPSSGFAQHVYFNQVGLYTTADALPDPLDPDAPITGTDDVGIPTTVFLVLTRPAAGETAYAGVRAFECQLNFNPIGGIFMLSGALGAPGLNIGDVDNIALGYLNYIVGFSAPVPVAPSESIILVTFSFLNQNAVPIEVTLNPAPGGSIPGQMVFLPDTPPILEQMFSSSGTPDGTAFTFNGVAVATEDATFGSVKALYR